MKPKDASFFELHVEKIVIALGLLILLVVVFFYFVGQPFTVEVNSVAHTPTTIEDTVRKEIETLDRKLRSEEPQIPDRVYADYTKNFRDRYEAQTVGWAALPTPLNQPGLGPDDYENDITVEVDYIVPTPPAPAAVVASSGYGLLDLGSYGDQPDLYQQYDSLIGNARPTDFRYVSVAGLFDLEDWKLRLLDPTVPEARRVPLGMWRGNLRIAGVLVEREQLDPATGQWGNRKVVPILPDQIAFTGENRATWAEGQASEAIRLIKGSQQYISQTPFPPMIGEQVWQQPGTDVNKLAPEDAARVRELDKDIANLQKRIKSLQERVARATGRPMPGADQGGGDFPEDFGPGGRAPRPSGRAGGNPARTRCRRRSPATSSNSARLRANATASPASPTNPPSPAMTPASNPKWRPTRASPRPAAIRAWRSSATIPPSWAIPERRVRPASRAPIPSSSAGRFASGPTTSPSSRAIRTATA